MNVNDDHENLTLRNKEFQEEEKEETEEEKEKNTYEADESFIRDEELGEHEEYEEERYGERSVEDEEVEEKRDVPSIATISAAAEKPEEEVQEVIEPDHVLAEIPVEVRINLSFCVILPVELLCLTTFVIF